MPSRATLSINQPSPGTLPHAGGCPPRCIPAQCHLQLPVSGLFGPRVPGASLPSPLPLSRWSPITVPSLKSGIPTFLHPRGGPDSPVPTRSPRPAARGWQRSRSAPTEGTSARSARAPLRVQTGAGLPPRAGMPSRLGPEVPPPCAPPPSCLGSRGVFSLVILHPGAPSPTVRSLDTETPLLTPCGEPQDADPGPCPHSLVES